MPEGKQGTMGFGGAINKLVANGGIAYKDGDTIIGDANANSGTSVQGSASVQGQEGLNAPIQNPNEPPLSFFQQYKMPILIGGGVAIVGVIGLIVFSVMSSNK